MTIEWFKGWRWHKKTKGFGLGINFEVYDDGFDMTIQIGPLYFGVEIYKS